MEPLYKVCPQCSQRAVPQMVNCGRCGFFYAPSVPPQSSPSYEKPLSDRAVNEFKPLPSPRSFALSPPAIIVCLLLVFVAGGWIVSRAREAKNSDLDAFSQFAMDRQDRTSRQTRPLTSDTANTPAQHKREGDMMRAQTDTPVSGSPFTERTTQTEIPTINITGTSSTTDTVYFRDENGQNYHLVVHPNETASLQLSAGNYEFRLVPGEVGVHGQYGDATFRQYKAYDLFITSGPDYGERGHIGDQ